MSKSEFWNDPDARRMMKAVKVLLMVIGILLLAVLLGFVVMFLWNVTMAEIFDLPTISYWQAVGLFLLAKMFFGFGGGSNSSKSKSHHGKKWKHGDTEEVDFKSDKEFKEFWRGEGKEAYRAYLAAQREEKEPE